jgi:hypothetical protein
MSIRTVSGADLVAALLANNWHVVGERDGVYKRLAILGESANRQMIVVPLDPAAPEYEDMLAAALGSVENLLFDGADARRVLHRLDPDLYQ